jgi:DNA-3-methyladenine glycosylase
MKPLPRVWFERAAPVLAPDLLNKVLVSTAGGRRVSGRVVEVEAYTEDDPASHTFPGRTPRNVAMFGPPGHVYVYLSYGIHHCVNVVAAPDGTGHAVLLRAVAPLDGIAVMRERRPGRPDRELADGPGKLASAFGLDLSQYGLDLTDANAPVHILDDGTPPPESPLVGPRIGLTKGIDTPWRFRC